MPMRASGRIVLLCLTLSVCALAAGVGIYASSSVFGGSAVFVFLRNFGADFLWALSMVFALAPFVKEIFPKKYPIVLVLVSLCCGSLFELLQAKGICRGTGDFWDCAVYLTAAVFGCLIIKKLYTGREKK